MIKGIKYIQYGESKISKILYGNNIVYGGIEYGKFESNQILEYEEKSENKSGNLNIGTGTKNNTV